MATAKKNTKLTKTLKDTFGHDEFRLGQLETIENILSGQSTLSIFPTGAGKSLCYQLPAVMLKDKTSIVISPLLSLMRDQLQQLEKLGIASTTLNSGQSTEEREKAIEDLEAGKICLLFISPESLLKKEYQILLKSLDLGIVAVDEAHCVSEWGNSFRPSYLLASAAIRKLKPLAILALTATATKEVARDIRSRFRIKTKDQVQNPLYRPNLAYKVIPCLSEQRTPELVKLLREITHLPAIVYVMKQIDAENVCAGLQASGINARAYHAGMNPEARKNVQDAFIEGKLNIVVATIAFGMGVNKADIRSVIHYHLPKSPEGWVQESGRAGRDGEPASCILLGCGDDLIPLTNFVQGAEISANAVERIVRAVLSQGNDITLSKYNLCQSNDVADAQLDIILSFMISAGHIVPNGTSWRYHQVSRLRYTTHDYGRSKQSLVNAINDHWGKIDSMEAEENFNVTRTRLLNIIDEMVQVGDVAAKTTGKLHHFTLRSEPADADQLIADLVSNFAKHKESSIKRLDAVLSAATTRSCVPARLIKYFGEALDTNCGKCTSCLGEKRARKLPSSNVPALTLDQLEMMKNVYEEHKKTLCTPSRLARFCCGILSPALRHARLYSNSGYGTLSHIPYVDIITQCRIIVTS